MTSRLVAEGWCVIVQSEISQCCGLCANAIERITGALLCASLATPPEHAAVNFGDGRLCKEFELI